MKTLTEAFTPLEIRNLVLKNRFIMAPMCQYSAQDGVPQDWHFQHYVTRALGGSALIIVEATAVSPEGRISPADLGIWNDRQEEVFTRLTEAVHRAGARVAVQLAHAGRKASTAVPWTGEGGVLDADGGWEPVGPGTEKFSENYRTPRSLETDQVRHLVSQFVAAGQRAIRAGFDTVEIHAAHGYLVHQFLSPLTNHRTDNYGGSPENRRRFLVEIIQGLRHALGPQVPLLLRVSATDWTPGGLTIEDTVATVKIAADLGVDFVDVSTGGLIPGVKIPLGPGYQVPFAEEVKKKTGLLTGAVGLIHDLDQASKILTDGHADAILLGRLLLRDPYWVARMAPADLRSVPHQYIRGF